MKNKGILLFKTLVKSTSILNRLKTTTDKKQRGKIIGGIVGMGVLYLMLMGYCVLMAVGYAKFGLADKLPEMTAVLICVLSFFMTVIKANSYLFGFREYEMLMALPFKEKTIVGSKFMYMYQKSLPWNLSISVAMLIGYAISVSPDLYIYPLWLVLAAFLPLIPMLLASLIGYLIARIGTVFKQWKIIQTVLIFVVVMLAIMSRFFIENTIKENETEEIINSVADVTSDIGKVFLPVKWFEKAITEGYILGTILIIAISVVLFEIVFSIFSISYRKINSSMKTGSSNGNFKLGEQKKRSVVSAMAGKEIKRFFGSTTYLVNDGLGYVFAILAGIVSLFVGLDGVLASVTKDAPLTTEMIMPAIPLVIYFMTGMVALTSASPSLEGKNYWIIKSLPMKNRDIYLGKILANLYISIPTHLLSTLLVSISAKAGIIETIGFMLLGVVLCLFSAVFGCACGIHFMKLEWENEVEVVKQGTAVVVYMFPNMILTSVMIVVSVLLAMLMDTLFVTLIVMLIYLLLTLLFWHRVKVLAEKH